MPSQDGSIPSPAHPTLFPRRRIRSPRNCPSPESRGTTTLISRFPRCFRASGGRFSHRQSGLRLRQHRRRLALSPMLMEKYMAAARSVSRIAIVAKPTKRNPASSASCCPRVCRMTAWLAVTRFRFLFAEIWKASTGFRWKPITSAIPHHESPRQFPTSGFVTRRGWTGRPVVGGGRSLGRTWWTWRNRPRPRRSYADRRR